jgi:hypothetical protein
MKLFQHSPFEFIERLACSVRTTAINASLSFEVSKSDSKLTIVDFDECDFVDFDNCAIADLHKSSAHIFLQRAQHVIAHPTHVLTGFVRE